MLLLQHELLRPSGHRAALTALAEQAQLKLSTLDAKLLRARKRRRASQAAAAAAAAAAAMDV